MRTLDFPILEKAASKLAVGDFEELPEGQRVVVCGTERFDPGLARPELFANCSYPIGIGFVGESEVGIKALAAKVSKELERRGHSEFGKGDDEFEEDVSLKLLALAQLCAHRSGEIAPCLDFVVDSVVSASLLQVATVAIKPPDSTLYEFGKFSYGPIDLEEVRRLSLHAGSSDYFEKHGSKLRGMTAVRLHQDGVCCLDCKNSFFLPRLEQANELRQALVYRLLDAYFQVISEKLWECFFKLLDSEQKYRAAAGMGYVGSSFLATFDRLVHRVSIFHRVRVNRGWVMPVTNCVDLSVPTARALKGLDATLSDGLRYGDVGQFPLDAILGTYCDYLFAAREYEAKHFSQDAFLHRVFALDFLMGGDATESLKALLSGRVAAITHRALGEEFSTVQRFVAKCYDLRSDIAHRGGKRGSNFYRRKAIEDDDYKRLREICQILFAVCCWCRRQLWCQDRKGWLTRIELAYKKLDAGLDASNELDELGVPRVQVHVMSAESNYIICWD